MRLRATGSLPAICNLQLHAGLASRQVSRPGVPVCHRSDAHCLCARRNIPRTASAARVHRFPLLDACISTARLEDRIFQVHARLDQCARHLPRHDQAANPVEEKLYPKYVCHWKLLLAPPPPPRGVSFHTRDVCSARSFYSGPPPDLSPTPWRPHICGPISSRNWFHRHIFRTSLPLRESWLQAMAVQARHELDVHSYVLLAY